MAKFTHDNQYDAYGFKRMPSSLRTAEDDIIHDLRTGRGPTEYRLEDDGMFAKGTPVRDAWVHNTMLSAADIIESMRQEIKELKERLK